LPDFFDTAVKEIDQRLRALKDEAARLEAARAALTGGRRRRGRSGRDGAVRTAARSSVRRNGRSAAARARRGGNTRANQALELVRKQPGITIPQIAKAMKIEPNYLYRVLPRLVSDGEVERDGQGWHPATSSAPTSAATRSRRQARLTKSERTAPATRATRRRRRAPTARSNGRTERGATRAAVLGALAGGEAMTAGQVATKAGLARPTVSTTLSKLAKSGDVQKAERGYRLASAG
jgi:predicted ArsR family transcriptional regulator